MHQQTRRLLDNRNFLKLWSSQTISLIGSGISFLALPLTAVIVLDATPAQMGLLTAASSLPSFLFSLFTGVFVDRLKRRPLMIWADVGRGLLLLLIPTIAGLGVLRIEYLYIISFLIGILSLLFDIAYRAFLPSIVPPEQLVEANSKLEVSRSASEVFGPTLAGGLIQIFSAPVAIGADAFSFLVSSLFLGLIKDTEPVRTPTENESFWVSIWDGLKVVMHNQTLRAITGTIAIGSFFNAMLEAIAILYLTRQLGISPSLQGLIFAMGSVGFLIGAIIANRVTAYAGTSKTIIGGLVVMAIGDLLIPLAGGEKIVIVIMLILGSMLFGLGLTLFNINQVSVRQTIIPHDMQGRVNATIRFLVASLIPLGALLGGWMAEITTLRLTLLIAVFGEFAIVFWLMLSPIGSPEADVDTITYS